MKILLGDHLYDIKNKFWDGFCDGIDNVNMDSFLRHDSYNYVLYCLGQYFSNITRSERKQETNNIMDCKEIKFFKKNNQKFLEKMNYIEAIFLINTNIEKIMNELSAIKKRNTKQLKISFSKLYNELYELKSCIEKIDTKNKLHRIEEFSQDFQEVEDFMQSILIVSEEYKIKDSDIENATNIHINQKTKIEKYYNMFKK